LEFAVLGNLSALALESVHSAIVICDAIDPEHPIVHVNPAFQTLTGYGSREILGRNCRFLQGTDRDQQGRKIIREALLNQRPVRAVLRNYRKDGSLFHNELFIDPILGPDGRATHFVACQNAIAQPDMATVRQTANTCFVRLTDREREVLQLVVNGHLNKVIAQRLGISERTVEKHRVKIFRKFQVSNLTHLVRYAIALGLPFDEQAEAAHVEPM
jgi:hypothetical protein